MAAILVGGADRAKQRHELRAAALVLELTALSSSSSRAARPGLGIPSLGIPSLKIPGHGMRSSSSRAARLPILGRRHPQVPRVHSQPSWRNIGARPGAAHDAHGGGVQELEAVRLALPRAAFVPSWYSHLGAAQPVLFANYVFYYFTSI